MQILKRNGTTEPFNWCKIETAINNAFKSVNQELTEDEYYSLLDELCFTDDSGNVLEQISVETVQDIVEHALFNCGYFDVLKSYILYRDKHRQIRDFSKRKQDFIDKYIKSNNTANATIDDNSNVANKNIAVLNSELYKDNNININRYRVVTKLRELYPEFDSKQYLKDLQHHIIYKNDENSTFGFPYCVSISMYPFILNGIKELGGLSAAPKNLDSFCGMFINLIFAISSQFAGAVATSEFLLFFDYFARKEWGDDYMERLDDLARCSTNNQKNIRQQLHQYFQQIVYSLNQPAAARGYQSVFWNVSYFDKSFFYGMFENFVFPDGSKPIWNSLNLLQQEFMKWFNEERLKTIITFPVESFALIYKNNEFLDKENADFVAQEYARGHSFFTYISDTADSLASCCRLRNKVQTKEFNFTNGNLGVETGSKSVITLNLNRIVQDWHNSIGLGLYKELKNSLKEYIQKILERVYKYHEAYNELLWDMYNAGLLPVYKAGFIHLNRQYLTIGLSGLTASAEYLGIDISDNEEYQEYCSIIFGTIKEQNALHKTTKTNYNCELIPAESAGIKLYNYDKEDGYWVPNDINLYTSYIFRPYDPNISVLERFRLHGSNYAGEHLDGGVACHNNLDSHLSTEQYRKLLKYAAEVGCNYFTFNVPNCQCDSCGFIAKQPFTKCPKCGETEHISLWDRIIGYLTKISNWSEGRQIEQKTRIYSNGANIT